MARNNIHMWVTIAAFNLSIAVMCGAFGAHLLKAHLSLEQMAWWQTSTVYFFIHALGLLILGTLIQTLKIPRLNRSAISLQFGIIIFCGSLYALALGAPRWFGAITPIGGLAFIWGWLSLSYQSYQQFRVGKTK